MGKHSQYQQWTRAWIRDNNNTTIMMTITRMTAANILYKLKIRCHLLSVLSLWAETFFSKPYFISYSCVASLLLTVAIIIVPHRYAIQSSTYVLSAIINYAIVPMQQNLVVTFRRYPRRYQASMHAHSDEPLYYPHRRQQVYIISSVLNVCVVSYNKLR